MPRLHLRRRLASSLANRFAAGLEAAAAAAGLATPDIHIHPSTHRLAVAFSGGVDSAATGLLAAWWAGAKRPPPSVAAALAAHHRALARRPPALPPPACLDVVARVVLELPALPSAPAPSPASPSTSGRTLPPLALIVDHGLRGADSAREAAAAARLAARLGLEPVVTTVAWREDGEGGGSPSQAPTTAAPLPPARPLPGAPLAAAARAARYRALTSAAAAHGAAAILMGHTADDQAETVIQRLGWASGVDGLGGVRLAVVLTGLAIAAGNVASPPILRPLLTTPKAALTALVRRAGLAWVADPSNALTDAGVRNTVRAALGGHPAAAAVACGHGRPATTTRHATRTLDAAGRVAARDARRLGALCAVARTEGEAAAVALLASAGVGDGSVAVAPLAAAPAPASRRVISSLLKAASGSSYPPDRYSVERVRAALVGGRVHGGRAVTGGGCIVRPVPRSRGSRVTIEKEEASGKEAEQER